MGRDVWVSVIMLFAANSIPQYDMVADLPFEVYFTFIYLYGNAGWKDQLTSFDGTTIT